MTKWIYEATANNDSTRHHFATVCVPPLKTMQCFLPIDDQHFGRSKLQRQRQKDKKTKKQKDKDKDKVCVFPLSRQCTASCQLILSMVKPTRWFIKIEERGSWKKILTKLSAVVHPQPHKYGKVDQTLEMSQCLK